MAEFIRSTVVTDYTPAADEVQSWDLPINPLSIVAVTVKAQQKGADVDPDMDELLRMVTNCEVLYRESAIYSASLIDLAVLYYALTGNQVYCEGLRNNDDHYAWVTVPILMGRYPFNPKECFFQTMRGEMKIRLTLDIANDKWDGLMITVETVELLDAKPERHLRANVMTTDPAAAGEFDLDLPLNGHLIGNLFYSTTTPSGDALLSTIEYVELMLNNVEHYYTRQQWEQLHNWFCMRGGDAYGLAQWDADAFQFYSVWNHYAYMDLDPTRDLMYPPDLIPLNRCHLRINAGDTEELRVIPVELVKAGGKIVP